MKHTATLNVEFNITPQELANMFCEMDAEQMANFFNEIYRNSLSWGMPIDVQFCAINAQDNLHEGGKKIMELIGQSVTKEF